MLACSSYFFEREEGFGFAPGKKSKPDGYSKVMSEKDMKTAMELTESDNKYLDKFKYETK